MYVSNREMKLLDITSRLALLVSLILVVLKHAIGINANISMLVGISLVLIGLITLVMLNLECLRRKD